MRIDDRSTNVARAGVLTAIVLAASLSAGGWIDASQGNAGTRVVDDAALADETSSGNWLAYGRTYSEQRFSPLTQVNDTTVSRLAPDWVVELPTDRGLVSTPLVVDGVMYFIGGMNVVRAVNATSARYCGSSIPRFAPGPARCAPAGITTAASGSGRARSMRPPGTAA